MLPRSEVQQPPSRDLFLETCPEAADRYREIPIRLLRFDGVVDSLGHDPAVFYDKRVGSVAHTGILGLCDPDFTTSSGRDSDTQTQHGRDWVGPDELVP